MQVVLFVLSVGFAVLGVADAVCTADIPTDGTNAIQLSFFRNTQGGTEGDDCPVACDEGSEIKQQWFAIASAPDDQCYQWPGNSGENSMQSGTCQVDSKSYTYSQWTNCECSGTVGSNKHVYVDRCVVDKPSTLCSKITNYEACQNSVPSDGSPTESPTTPTSPSPSASPSFSSGLRLSVPLTASFIAAKLLFWA